MSDRHKPTNRFRWAKLAYSGVSILQQLWVHERSGGLEEWRELETVVIGDEAEPTNRGPKCPRCVRRLDDVKGNGCVKRDCAYFLNRHYVGP